MDIHKNARLTLKMREQLARHVLEHGLSRRQAALRFQVSGKTAGKWVARYRQNGVGGLGDGSSRPHRLRRATPDSLVARVEQLRRGGGIELCSVVGERHVHAGLHTARRDAHAHRARPCRRAAEAQEVHEHDV